MTAIEEKEYSALLARALARATMDRIRMASFIVVTGRRPGQQRVYGFDRNDIPAVDIDYGQPMLTVKDDYEDHAAAIRSPKECQFFKEYDAYTGFLALQDHFNSRNLR